jgi:hydrogenase expression/formation protein HypC
MCMSRPGRVVTLKGGVAEVEINGRRAWFNALLVPDVKPGDWVLTHTSLVVSQISETDAEAVNALLYEAMEVCNQTI